MIAKALSNEPLPVYGTGRALRDWLHVEDHARALRRVFEAGRPGQTYAIGGSGERSTLEVVRTLCALLDDMAPRPDGRAHASRITFVPDRPGHDLHYAIDAAKIRRDLGWTPRESFESGLRQTIAWYLDNEDWWRGILAQRYDGRRLGLPWTAPAFEPIMEAI